MKGSTLHIEDGKSTPAKGLGPERAPLATTRLSFVADLAAIAVIVIGFAAQFGAMRSRYLSPDEAFNLSFAGGRDLMDAYQGSKATPHPPLFFLLMHFWMRLGRSELFLRLLPAIFGAAFLWFLYRWSLRLFGRTAGFVALLFGVFSPALLPLSSEVRGYSLFLFLSAAGLAAFESAVEADSPVGMAASFLLLWLAILAHYAGLFIVLALAVYAPFRLRKRRSSRKVVAF
ncbi:MAG TPA: glycosyltransferase family 39 protein, partial [Thermoanaerobaculia bacterium]|nr:glycosyltransferase family 39 protein [Thermoanaerobaculia bacterium]